MGKKFVLDTSIIIDGKVPDIIRRGDPEKILVPYIVLDELEAQASKGKEGGFVGLEELKEIRRFCEQRGIELAFLGERPGLDDIKLARSGRLDALIRDMAKKDDAILVTADYVQALVGEAEGVDAKYVPQEVKRKKLSFKQFFTEDTMSVHLKDRVSPYAKKGEPGKFDLVKIREDPCTDKELKRIIREITEAARTEENAFVEVDEAGATVVQLGEYRIAIAKPPFSDGLEVTIVRPIVKLRLKDYHLSQKMMERLRERAEGILIAGPPGSGKTTFASSLADFYSNLGKITKTMESPRDLQVSPKITQYAPLDGSFAKTTSILLLVRPDYTVFDEVREREDFTVFADMRLAGVGMVGVVHSTDAVDAIQRFINRVELGMIPSVMDTIIFIKYGEIKKVYDISMTVKVPSGMTEADLARPLVEVRDFETGKLEYEIYTFGKENVVVPVTEKRKTSPMERLAEERIYQIMSKYDKGAQISMMGENRVLVKVHHQVIPKLIGKNGRNISRIEKKLGIHIDVEPKTT
ncbi:MAG: PINc/VapC family ATPase [Thermoproteota archaeon]